MRAEVDKEEMRRRGKIIPTKAEIFITFYNRKRLPKYCKYLSYKF